jgi:hypothetical protein
MSPGSMNPTSVKSLDLHFTKQADNAQAGPVTIKKGGFGTVQGNMQVRGDVYDYAGWTSTAGSALNRGARKDDLQELLEGDSGKAQWIFEYKVVFWSSIFTGCLARFHDALAFLRNLFE